MTNKVKRHGLLFVIISLALIFSIAVGVLPIIAEEPLEDQGDSKPDTVQVVVAARNVSRGIRLSDAHYEVITVKNENLPTNIITDATQVVSKYTKVPLYEGEYIYADQLSSKKVNKLDNDLLVQDLATSSEDYVVVTDYVMPNTGKDISSHLQSIIDKNPKRTIYFPAGEYLISTPLVTPAIGTKSVSIQLADDAVIKATNTWRSIKREFEVKGETTTREINSLIALGAGEPYNDIVVVGSYYSLKGGTLDGNGKADGVSIQSGRESQIRNLCIKNFATNGIYIAQGANGNSSDCDFEDITIIGDGTKGTRGIFFRGYDNTVSNVRIYNCEVGIESSIGQGNLFKGIYFYNDPALCGSTDQHYSYDSTIAFKDGGNSNNWISDSYAENYATAFLLGSRSLIWDCTAKWTSGLCTTQIFLHGSSSTMAIGGCRAEFLNVANSRTVFVMFSSNTKADIIEGCMFNEALCKDKTYKENLKTPVIPIG